ncbi:hypothetical protein [Roseibium sediminis]|uniref:hypothetical protein n=1 Tax=Roseibium sediminis TaxID=1775174 RepID=UPI00123E2758|nr:hypothetical protein [Roseibium sediminis]
MKRQTVMAIGLGLALSGCALGPDKGLVDSLVSFGSDEYALPADVVADAPPPTGLIDEEERVATMDHLRSLAADNASKAATEKPTADELLWLKDNHGKAALDEIEGGEAATQLRN